MASTALHASLGLLLCTTTFEAPLAGTISGGGAPIEVTRCGPVETTSEVFDQRFFSYTSPFARGIDITHQITDLLGISMGGGDGTRVMGFGFPDQTIVWDGSAIENTYRSKLQEQSRPVPKRVIDLPNAYGSSLQLERSYR